MNLSLFRRAAVAAFAALCVNAVGAHEYKAGDLRLNHPWARVTVPGQKAGGAFLAIRNAGNAADRLVGASSPAAERVEVHTMSMQGDVMRMRQIEALDLPPGQTVQLQPGHLHLMLMNLKAPLKQGDKVPVTLRFEKAGEVKLEFWVETGPATDTKPAAGHHHQH